MSPGQARGLVGHVQQFGLATAAAVVDRYTVLAEQALGVDPLAALDRARADDAPLAHVVAGMARAYLDLLAAAADAAAGTAGPATGPGAVERIVLPAVPAGGRTWGSLWLHNPTGESAPGLRVGLGAFTAAGGASLPPSAITVSPPAADLAAGTSLELRLDVAVPAQQPPGTYHGIALVGPAPHDPVVLSLEVLPGGTAQP